MDHMAMVSAFQNVVVPGVVREILLEGGWPVDFRIGDGKRDELLRISLPHGRATQIPRNWEVRAGHPVILKNWIAAEVHAALVNSRSAR